MVEPAALTTCIVVQCSMNTLQTIFQSELLAAAMNSLWLNVGELIKFLMFLIGHAG